MEPFSPSHGHEGQLSVSGKRMSTSTVSQLRGKPDKEDVDR